MDNANTTRFVDLVLPDVGVFVVAPFAKRSDGTVVPYQVFARDKDHFLRAALAEDEVRSQTVYFSTASVLREGGGNQHRNVAAKKCLHIDIDVGHEGFVSTRAEAIAQLYALCDAAMIPPPSAIVSSGYGVHAYWSVRGYFAAHEMDEWQHLSNGLAAAAEAHTPGLAKDLSKWKDRTALLRLPGTRNKKRAEWVTVEEIGGTYLAYDRHDLYPLKTFAPETKSTAVTAVRHIAPVDGEVLRTHCAVIRDLAAGGKIPYKAWVDLIHYSHHTSQGVEWAHELSKGPDYNPDKLNAIFETYVARHKEGTYHPTSCATFCANAGVDHQAACIECPLFQARKSPLALRSAASVLAPSKGTTDIAELVAYAEVDASLPDYFGEPIDKMGGTFSLSPQGQLYFTPDQTDSDRKAGPLYSHAWWCVSCADENNRTYYEIARVMGAKVHRAADGVAYVVPTSVTRMRVCGDIFAEPRMLIKGLAAIGIHYQGADKASRDTAFWYGELTRSRCLSIQNAATSFGWQLDGKRFVLGMGAFEEGGLLNPYVMGGKLLALEGKTRAASTAINPTGSTLGAIAALQEYISHSTVLGRALLLAALSTPLFKLVDLPGYVVLLAGQGGKGKTSLQRLLSCVYSRPEATMITGQDTLSSWPMTLGLYNSIPVTFDEFTVAGQSGLKPAVEESKDHFIFLVTNGRTKKVNTAEQVQLGGDATWATLVVASSNWDYISGLKTRDYTDRCDAILARMSQISIGGGIMGLADWVRVDRLFSDNHGWIGGMFVSRMMSNLGTIQTMLSDEFAAAMRGMPQEARFKRKLLAATMVAQKLLRADNIDFGLTADEIAHALELDRLDPTTDAVHTWNKPSIAQPGSPSQEGLISYVLQSLHDRFEYYAADHSGKQTLMVSMSLPRNVCGRVVAYATGETVYTVSKAAILFDKQFASLQSLASVLGGLETCHTQLTQYGPHVECVRITKRNKPALTAAKRRAS